MKQLFKASLIASILIIAASFAMFVSSIWTGDGIVATINVIQFVLVALALLMACVLFRLLGKGTMVRRLWGVLALIMLIDLVAVALEMVNGFAGEWKVSQDVIFLIYMLVWLVLLLYPVILYMAFKQAGLSFDWHAIRLVLPSLIVVSLASLVVVLIPLMGSAMDAGTKISNFVALIIGQIGVYFSVFFTMTLGKGRSGRPWIFITLALVAIVIQTIITTQITMVAGSMRVLEPANFFLHLGYAFVVAAEYFQYELISG